MPDIKAKIRELTGELEKKKKETEAAQAKIEQLEALIKQSQKGIKDSEQVIGKDKGISAAINSELAKLKEAIDEQTEQGKKKW